MAKEQGKRQIQRQILLKSTMLSIKISSYSHLYVNAKFAHVMLWFSSISPNCTVTFCAKSSAVVTPCSQKLYMMVIRVPPASGPNSGVALNSTDAVNNATTNARLVSMYTYNHVHLHYTYNDTVARAAGSYVCTWRNTPVHSHDATIQSSARENETDCAFCALIKKNNGKNFKIIQNNEKNRVTLVTAVELTWRQWCVDVVRSDWFYISGNMLSGWHSSQVTFNRLWLLILVMFVICIISMQTLQKHLVHVHA